MEAMKMTKERTMLRKAGIPWIVVGMMVLAACGGGSNSGSNETQSASDGSGAQVGRNEFGMTDEQLVTNIESVEASIASCMAAAGFEYIPIDAVTFQDAMGSLGSAPGVSDEEFVTQYGYGLTTLPPKVSFGAGEDNAAILNDLTAADQTAYTRMLLGDDFDATFVIMLELEDFGPAGGCTKTAVEEVFTAEQLGPNFANPFDSLVNADQRMIDALRAWSVCMKDAGYDYELPEDAEDELIERFDALTGGANPATLTGSDKDALTELQGQERAVAQVDLVCQEKELRQAEEQIERDISGRN
jgi:hypothetical protein